MLVGMVGREVSRGMLTMMGMIREMGRGRIPLNRSQLLATITVEEVLGNVARFGIFLGRVASVVGIMDLFDGWMMGLELNESREVLLNTYGIEVTRIEERDNGAGRTWLQNTSRSYYTVHRELDLWRYMPYSRVASRYVNPCLLCREMSF
jgi:hypothetical protein